jgi:hypothetical protein
MKNRAVILTVGLILLTVVLGCSRIIPGGSRSTGNSRASEDNKTLTDRGLDVALGDEKIGIPECDDVVDFFNREIDNPDDDFVTKAVKKTVLNKMKDQFKQAVEDNKTDKVQLARTCKDFKANLDKYKSEENDKKAANSK